MIISYRITALGNCLTIAFGMAEELGPFHIDRDGKTLYLNPYAWNQEMYLFERALLRGYNAKTSRYYRLRVVISQVECHFVYFSVLKQLMDGPLITFRNDKFPLAYVVKNALLDTVISILESLFHLGNVEPKDDSVHYGNAEFSTQGKGRYGSPLEPDSCSMVAEPELDIKESEDAAS
ncbi:hypothetical protein RHSIM_RhsimUnG0249900 [Rhododendron simsii]|uniref:Uncharacterized protein n=1 Tax=Rhododendron simsii TaxID=118357 RepID=A0A834FV20_RHOSS|nr:hypothetical protein RHSIM_RhsimUnG0249900 [Rhododendron simsii]